MDANQMLGVLAAIIGAFFSIIILMIGWNWNKLHQKVDDLVSTLREIADEVREEINNHEVRITVLEKTKKE